jgi:hypothetical protein
MSRSLCLFFNAGFLVFFGWQAYSEKLRIFARYADEVRGIPRLNDFQVTNPAEHVNTVVPDLAGDSLNLFLYVNRFNTVKFAFNDTETGRYRSVITPNNSMSFVRVSVPGYKDKVFADITHSIPWRDEGPYLIAAEGELRVKGPNWLPPEGSVGDNMFRWLSSRGDASFFVADSSQNRYLLMKIYPGPDLLPENVIEIQLNGSILKTLIARDLPTQLSLLLGNLNSGVNNCSLEVIGPVAGIRQVSVAKMSTHSHVN